MKISLPLLILIFLSFIGLSYSLGITSCSELFDLNDEDHYLQNDIGKTSTEKKRRKKKAKKEITTKN